MAGRLHLSALRSGFSFAAAATPPLPNAPTTPPQLGVVQGKGTVTFTLNGVPRWLIDITRFAGTPSLTLVPGQGEVQSRLTLDGARLPGTDLPADFVVVIGKTGPLGTSADFTFTFGGFHGQVILEHWLAGSAVLQSAVTLNGEICALGASSELAFTASGEARFAPDWLMEIVGTDLATISGLGSPIPSSQLTVQLLAPTDPSISQHPEPKRTLLKMPAGGHIWSLTPEVTSLPIGTLSAVPGLFAAIAIEAGEGPGGKTARELVASSSNATGLTLAVAGGFTDQNGHPFRLSLASPSYGIAFDTSPDHSEGDQTVVAAGFSTPGWLVVDGFALLLGDSPASSGFECDALNQNVTSLRCELALIGAAAPLSAASGQTVAAQPLELIDVTLPFVTAPGTAPGWGIVAGPEITGQRRFSLPDFGVSVLRRDDLLALDFQFFNLALEGGGGNPAQLVPKNSSEPAFLVAQFNSPQNIAEQAYLEDSPNTSPAHTPPPPGTDPQSLSLETPDAPGAVQTRAAGPSRLAFQLPSGTTALPYSLDSLLDWVALQQSVVAVAAVPDSNQAEPNPEVDNDLTALAGAVAPAANTALVGYWGTDNSVHVNFIGADKHVHELVIVAGANWVDNDLTALAGAVAPAANTALVGFWGTDASVHVNFIGTDAHVHELYIVPGANWVDNDLTALAGAVPPAAGSALVGFWGTDDSVHANFIGTDNHIHELYIAPGRNWVDNDLTALAGAVPPAAGSALVGFWGTDASVHVNFIGTDDHVHELYIVPGANWVDNDLTALAGAVAPAASTPLVGFRGTDASVHVNFIGTDNHIHELYIAPGANWVDNDLTAVAGAVAPAANTTLDGFWGTHNSQHINFIGTDNHVHELFIGPATNGIDNDLTALAGAVAPAATTALVGFWRGDGSVHVDFIGADNHVHDLYTAPGAGWIVPQPKAPAQTPQIQQSAATETAIEAPWRLFLSPNYSGAWAHSATPVTLSNRTELWHTRLAVRTLQGDGLTVDETIPRRVRAVWSPDYTKGAIPDHPSPPFGTDPAAPFRMSLDPDDRDQIVRLSSDFTMSVPTGEAYVPISIPADKLYLSTLGAWIEVFGNWPEQDQLPPEHNQLPSSFSVLQWQHRAALGRDNYVRVVYAGFLLPFGNDASLVKVTERKLQSINGGPTTAYLRQKFFVIVRQPTMSYSSLTDAQQRNLPYHFITITTLVTPDVVPQVDDTGRYAFFPTSGQNINPNTFFFHIVGTDWEGNTSEFTAPLYFVERGGDFTKAVQAYNSSGAGTRPLLGQKIAFAQPNNPSDTSLHTTTLTFSAQPPAPPPTAPSPFFPSMDAADVVVPAIQQVSGGSGEMPIQFFADYLNNGMGKGEVFAQKTGTPQSVGFNGKQSGGVATPNLTVSGLSRKFGTVSSGAAGSPVDPTKLANINNGTFDPSDIFKDLDAKLFGVVSLADLLDDVAGLTNPNQLPGLKTERLPDQIKTTLSFTPLVKKTYSAPSPPFPADFITLAFKDDPSQALALNATIVMPLTGGDPQVSIHGELNNFTLSLAKVVGITINQIAFDAPAGQKLSVTASMPPTDDDGPIQFLGDLSFLNELRKYIPSDGFEDPPSLDVTSDGITAGFSLPIPSIGVGVFSLENINLSAALTLPFFTPEPIRFRFAFCEREHPFNITVSFLGGGGFFGITVGPDGVEILEASIEVGANVSIDVVVASGNVHVMAGVYLKYDMTGSPPSSQLTGYLRAGGSLDVLGLISASVEFYLGFTYFFGPPCSIAGEATITIEVHVLFFSASVSATLHREFGDPTISFAQLIGPTDWDDYCDAFAA